MQQGPNIDSMTFKRVLGQLLTKIHVLDKLEVLLSTGSIVMSSSAMIIIMCWKESSNAGSFLPYFCGVVAANLDAATIAMVPSALHNCVMFGWASVNGGEPHKMVMSIAKNAFFKNSELSMVS